MISKVAKQLFAKMTLVQKRQVAPKFAEPSANKELTAAMENTSKDSLDSSVTGPNNGKSMDSSTDSAKRMLSLDADSN